MRVRWQVSLMRGADLQAGGRLGAAAVAQRTSYVPHA